jgi:hypothetical protein
MAYDILLIGHVCAPVISSACGHVSTKYSCCTGSAPKRLRALELGATLICWQVDKRFACLSYFTQVFIDGIDPSAAPLCTRCYSSREPVWNILTVSCVEKHTNHVKTSTDCIIEQAVLGRTNRLLSSIRQGPHWRVQQFFHCVGFEVFTAVVMKSIIFLYMTPCSPLSCNRRFGGTYRLHLQGRRMISARTSRQEGSKQNIMLRPWR